MNQMLEKIDWKRLFNSWTFWGNIGFALIPIVQYLAQMHVLDAKTEVLLMALCNVILRVFKTSEPIYQRGSKDVEINPEVAKAVDSGNESDISQLADRVCSKSGINKDSK